MSEQRCANCMRELAQNRGPCPHCGFDAAKYRPPDDALPPGSLLNNGKYVLGRVLGRGGFGITYAALDRNLELRVAVKECLPAYAARREPFSVSVQWGASKTEQAAAMQSLIREARKMAKIDQIPGVVRARDCFEDNNTAYIVMDYLDGATLADRLQRTGPLSAESAYRILSPVMDALAQAHKRGVVHRDITPGNVMIERADDGEKTWLLDLGAAKDLGTRISAPNVSAFSQMVGTPGYAPLEQYTPEGRIGPWTDVYSLSAVFFYAMTGKTPPASTSRALEGEKPELLQAAPGAVGDVLRKGMALRPEERYQTMGAFKNALKKAVYPPPPPPPKPAPPPPKPKVEPDPPKEKPLNAKRFLTDKNILILMIIFVIIAGCWAYFEQQLPTSGKCGDNATWTLNKDGLLAISGTGDMWDYSSWEAPWKDYDKILSSAYISPGITRIGNSAFYDCGGLTNVVIPDSVTEIGQHAFSACYDLTSITIPDSVTEIGEYAFEYCSALMNIVIPNSVTKIEDYAFASCYALTNITIPNSVMEIGEYAFSWSGLKNVTIPNSVTTIEGHVFNSCDFISVTIPDNITTIEEYAFANCGFLTSVVISDGVTKIDGYAFQNCYSLESVEIPDSVTEIRGFAFSGCNSLKSVIIPSGTGDDPGGYVFENCTSLESVFMSEGFTTIGYGEFANCSSLKIVEIPDSVTTIRGEAFIGCSSLENVDIPDSVTEIGEYAFANCDALTSVSVPAEAYIQDYAFPEHTTVIRRW